MEMSWMTVRLYRKSDYSPPNLHLTFTLINIHERAYTTRHHCIPEHVYVVLTIFSRESWYFFSHESVSYRLTVRRSACSIRENISLAKKSWRKKKEKAKLRSDNFSFQSLLPWSLTRIFVTRATLARERIKFPGSRRSRNNLTDVFPKYGKTGDTARRL